MNLDDIPGIADFIERALGPLRPQDTRAAPSAGTPLRVRDATPEKSE
jgi:hypothetical protein